MSGHSRRRSLLAKSLSVAATLTLLAAIAPPRVEKYRLNRFDYNLQYNKLAESVQIVAPEVKIELVVAASAVPS